MGQEFSSHGRSAISLKGKKMSKKQRMDLWQQMKDQEVNHLREKARETENQFKLLRKQIDCHSYLLKEILEDRLREQREEQKMEMQKMSNEMQKSRYEIEMLKKEIAEMKHKTPHI
jgi:chromosome segregation ATPase